MKLGNAWKLLLFENPRFSTFRTTNANLKNVISLTSASYNRNHCTTSNFFKKTARSRQDVPGLFAIVLVQPSAA